MNELFKKMRGEQGEASGRVTATEAVGDFSSGLIMGTEDVMNTLCQCVQKTKLNTA